MTAQRELHETGATRFVGASIPRREDPRLLSGRGLYVDDIIEPGMLHVAFVRSDIARGRIAGVGTSAAEALPGVRAVLLASDIEPPPGTMLSSLFPPGAPSAPQRGLARTDVRYVGEPIAMVIADSRHLAEDGADLVEVDIEPLPAVVDYETAEGRSDLVHPELGTNVAARGASDDPELTRILAEAPHVVTFTFHQQRQTNSPMETRGIVATWRAAEGTMTVRVSSQSPHEVRNVVARVLEVDEGRVRAIQQDVGGGFGQKMILPREELLVALAAKRLGGTLKWIEDRRENLIASTSARIGRVTVTWAFDDDGIILGCDVDHLEDIGACPAGVVGGTATQAMRVFPGPYRIPHHAWRSTTVWTNTVGRGAYRGPWMIETVAREQSLDHAARALGLDPLELRRRNLIRAADLPHTTRTGWTYDVITPSECLDQAVAILDYDAARATQEEARAGGRLVGIGMAVFVEPTSRGGGTKLGTEPATVRLTPTGKVDVHLGTGNHGQAIETTIAQVVADELGMSFEDVQVRQGDTASSPFGAGTGGSRTAVVVGGAARASSTVLRRKILSIAAHLLEAAEEDLEISGGVISVVGTPIRSVTAAKVAATALLRPDELPAELDLSLEATERFRALPVTWSNAAHLCVVEVHPITGRVEILRYIVSEDCGVMINPMVVEGQIRGGVMQGIAGVLYEELPYDEYGNPLASTFMDYLLPTASEAVEIEMGHVETRSASPGGHKGMGEGGAIGSVPCVANAIADALAPLGIALTDLPFSPSRLSDRIAESIHGEDEARRSACD